MTRPVRVVHVVQHLGIGGAERLLLTLLDAIDRRAFEPVVVALQGDGPIGEAIRRLGVETVALHRRGGLLDIVASIRLARLFRRLRPAIVQTHTFYPGLHGRLAARLADCQVIVATEHGLYDWKRARHLVFDWWLDRRTDRIIAVSRAVERHLRRQRGIANGRLVVMPNAVRLEEIRSDLEPMEAKRRLGYAPSDLVIGCVGRLESRKGQDLLIRAFAQVGVERARLLLIGLDPVGFRVYLERLSQTLKVQERVRIVDAIPSLPDAYRAMDLLALPSRTEGFGLVLVEAMAMGLPVVASRVGGVPEVLGADVEDVGRWTLDVGRDGIDELITSHVPRPTSHVSGYQVSSCGLLVPPEDPEAMAEGIATLLQDGALRQRLGEAGQHAARERFDHRSYARRLERLYVDVLNEKKV